LNAAGWTGTFFGNNAAYPQDFMEACQVAGGDDHNWADANRLAVYAGHGYTLGGSLVFGYPNQGICSVDLGAHARLGSMSGSQAAIGIWITSCTLTGNSLVGKANFQWLWQQLGFHDSPSVGSDSPRAFFQGTQSSSNRSSWFANMEDRPGWFTGDNSPMVVSYGSTAFQADDVRVNAKLKGLVYAFQRPGPPACGSGQPLFYWNYEFINHGQGPCF